MPQLVPDFDTRQYHYDWWMFPLPITELGSNCSPRAMFYAIDSTKTIELLKNTRFKAIYTDFINRYLSMQEFNWNGYGIRFAKMLISMRHFISFTDDEKEHIPFNIQLREIAQRALRIAEINNIKDEFNAITPIEKYLKENPPNGLPSFHKPSM